MGGGQHVTDNALSPNTKVINVHCNQYNTASVLNSTAPIKFSTNGGIQGAEGKQTVY